MRKSCSALLFISVVIFLASCGQNKKSTQPATSNPVTAKWKIGVQTYTFRLFSLEDALKKVDSAGMHYVEFYHGQPITTGSKDVFGTGFSPEGRAALKQAMANHNVSAIAMGVISPTTREEWVKSFELAKEFGMKYITSEPRKDLWDMIDTLAGQYGIKVAIHEHARPNLYWHPDSVLAAIKGHKNIGACADLGHWARSGLDPVECLKKLDGHIIGVHFKDITTFGDTHSKDTVVGKGVLKYPEIFAELYRQKFDGMFSIEHESNWMYNLTGVIEAGKVYNKEVGKLHD